MRPVLGLASFIILVVATILMGSQINIFINIPAIIIVIGTTVTLTISRYTFKEILKFENEVASSAINNALVGGCVGFVIGFIQLLANISEAESVGPGLAVTFLSVFYSIILSAIIYSQRSSTVNKQLAKAAAAGPFLLFLPVMAFLFSVIKN